MHDLGHFMSGKRISGKGNRSFPVMNPAKGEIIRHVTFATKQEIDEIVQNAQNAFPKWAETPPATRGKILSKFKNLLENHETEIATLIAEEHGKSILEAKGSLARGLDVLDYASNIAAHLKGDHLENVGRNIDCYSMRQPIGVCVGITPFNFPAMIPLWIGSIAIACGNAFILKPSERDPSCPLRIAELAYESGIPEGIFNVVQGDKEVVDILLAHPIVKTISFVGQTETARYIQETGIHYGKRVQAFGGAKNHMLIMPDTDLEQTIDALVGAAYGSAGERCMAISVAMPVGDQLADKLVAGLSAKIKNLKIGPYTDPDAEMGPLINQAHLEKVKNYIDQGIKDGAKLVVDGRSFQHPTEPKGYFLGGCLFDHVQPNMSIYKHEIFGPVLCIVRIKSYEEGLQLINSHPYGNGVALYTRDGDTARDFCNRVEAGMVGINVPVPVPVAQQSFGGWKNSSFADIGMHGMEGIRFFTKLKTVTERWPSGIRKGVEFSLLTTEHK
ncbi:MAG: CoA-acylating methylmalonate-semialdehyde dehydrogenase [Alphaproteobacteria bacterium]|nr:CoA-acylating methylmalonate-semialdehyde dehydrogenase [Alphaproteobacteria bacterium]